MKANSTEASALAPGHDGQSQGVVVAGLAVDIDGCRELDVFWRHVMDRGLTAVERQAGRSSAAFSPDRLAHLVKSCVHDAGVTPGERPLFLAAEPGAAKAAGLSGFEYPNVTACLTGAMRALGQGDDYVLAGIIGQDGAMLALRKMQDGVRDGGLIYAVLDTSHEASEIEAHAIPLLAAASAEHLAAAILCLNRRVQVSGLLLGITGPHPMPWIHPTGQRRRFRIAGDESAGVTILEPPALEHRRRRAASTIMPRARWHLFLLSAQTPHLLLERIAWVRQQAQEAPATDLARLARSLGRTPAGEDRLGLVVESSADLQEKLQQATDVLRNGRGAVRMRTGLFYGQGPSPGKIAFLFPGQGSQYPGMLRELAMRSPAVREWFDDLDAAYQRAGQALPSATLNSGENRTGRLFDMETGAQLGLVASLAMHQLLLGLGVRPDCMLGHSNGEHAAMYAAGLIDAATRTQLCDEVCQVGIAAQHLKPPDVPEQMIAVSRLDRALLTQVLARHKGEVFVAVDNCPSQVLLGGTQPAIESVTGELRKAGSVCTSLPFERAHHTPLFSDWAALLREHYSGVAPGVSNVPVYSAATSDCFPSNGSEIWDLMAGQWCMTVRFRETLERLYQDGVRVFVETGPDAKLCAFVNDTLRKQPHIAVAASSSVREEMQQVLHLCADLYAAGIDLQTQELDRLTYGDVSPAPVREPAVKPVPAGYTPRIRIQNEFEATMAMVAAAEARIRARLHTPVVAIPERRNHFAGEDACKWPLTGTLVSRESGKVLFNRQFDIRQDLFLRDHAMGSTRSEDRSVAVLAFSFSMALAAEAAVRAAGGIVVSISRVRAHRWLALDGGSLPLRIEATSRESSTRNTAVQVRIFDVDGRSAELAFDATVEVSEFRDPVAPVFSGPIEGAPPKRWTADSFYSDYAFHGAAYQGLRTVKVLSGNRIEAELTVTDTPGLVPEHRHLDASLLDCAGQLAAFWLLESGEDRPGLFPFSVKELQVGAPPPRPGTVIRCRGTVERSHFGSTRASFDFVLPDGRVLWHIQDLEQKILRFPGKLSECLFGKDDNTSISEALPAPDGLFVSWINAERANFLRTGQALWARILARSILTRGELLQLRSLARDVQVSWLLEQIAAREAVRRWAASRGVILASRDIVMQNLEGSARVVSPLPNGDAPNLSFCSGAAFASAAAMDSAQRLSLDVIPGGRTPAEAEMDRVARRKVVWRTETDGYQVILKTD